MGGVRRARATRGARTGRLECAVEEISLMGAMSTLSSTLPPTGDTTDYTVPIIIGVVALIVIIVAVVLIIKSRSGRK